jgi:hypothetical protein
MLGVAHTLAQFDAIVDSEAPAALRNMAHVFRYMFRQLDLAALELQTEAYRRADSALKTLREKADERRDWLEKAEARWAIVVDEAAMQMEALQTYEREWRRELLAHFVSVRKLLLLSRGAYWNVTVPKDVDKFRRLRGELQTERNELFGSLIHHLSVDDGVDGLAEMEALDRAFDAMDSLADSAGQHCAELEALSPQVAKARQDLDAAFRPLCFELSNLCYPGQIALVRIVRLFTTLEYEDYRADFLWLHNRRVCPTALAKDARAIHIEGGVSHERPLDETV